MGQDAVVPLLSLARQTALPDLAHYRGKSVIIDVPDQLSAALALLELDGIARRILLCPPDLAAVHRSAIEAEAEADVTFTSVGPLTDGGCERGRECVTEWILLTSGTSGRPKLVRHSLASLIGPAQDAGPAAGVWSTFYDIRRYGGLTILMRALLGGTSMLLSSAKEEVGAFLTRAAAAGVTQISGTPTHWRRALMSPQHLDLHPSTVRLSGEIASQATIDQLRRAFPGAQITHAFASTEAGVAFEVTDGLDGFPTAFLERDSPVAIRVRDGTLRIRSARTATDYLAGPPLRDQDGFVDTGDAIVIQNGRCTYAGRASGVVNVGGAKVYPEEIEAVLNAHPDVRMALVTARRSPITGALVSADIVPADPEAEPAALRARVMAFCHSQLPAHKVPALLHVVPSLAMNTAGKLARA